MNIDSTVSAKKQIDYSEYVMDQNHKIVGMRNGGRGNSSLIVQYEDGSEWVYLGNRTAERFCGFLYLQEALKQAGLENVFAAQNKLAVNNGKILYLSRYCGERKPQFEEVSKVNQVLSKIGFTDNSASANMRKIDDTMYIFDTEKLSFDKSVYAAIDSFKPLHDEIRSRLN